jgi:hypothetical protein
MDARTGVWLLLVSCGGMSVIGWGPLASGRASGQQPLRGAVQPSRPYDGFQAGLDALRLAEEKRQAAITTQLGWNQFYLGQAIAPPGGAVIVYGGNAWPPIATARGRELAYAYGASEAAGSWEARGWVRRLPVFEPWPVVLGDIYGGVVQPPLRQPVAQWQGQTGPDRWESHPVYDPPVPEFRPLPEVDSPLLDGTPFAAPRKIRPRER